jgi:hypothetical protein
MSILVILIVIAASLTLVVGIAVVMNARKKKKKESELGIFHHPSNFKKPPIEWVQKPKSDDTDETTKKF